MSPSPMPLAVRVIRAEHDALAAMLRTVPLVLQAQRRAQDHGGGPPDFEALRAMLGPSGLEVLGQADIKK